MGLGSDELYFEVDAGPLNPPLEDPRRIDDGMWFTFLPADGRPVYEGVDSRETVQDTRPVYIGRAVPLIVRTRMWEHDHGDPNALRHQIKTAVAAAGTVTAAFVPAASSIATDPNVQATVTNVLNGIVGTDDDFLGQGEFRLASRRDIPKTLNTPPHNEHGILLQHKIFLTIKTRPTTPTSPCIPGSRTSRLDGAAVGARLTRTPGRSVVREGKAEDPTTARGRTRRFAPPAPPTPLKPW